MQHEFEHAGLKCRATQTSMGHWCGYVAVPEGHPWYGLSYSDKVSVTQEVLDRPVDIDRIGVINLLCADKPTLDACEMTLAVDVHGGLTFSGKHRDGTGWWLGFDCAHCDDDPSIQDQAYTEAECRSLAEQLAKFA